MKKVQKSLALCVLCAFLGLFMFSGVSDRSEIDDLCNEDFANDRVIIVLTKEATRQFLDYGPEDFPEVELDEVVDLTSFTVDWVEKKIKGIPTDREMLVNVEEFKRILSLRLANPSKKNVLRAVALLEQRKDVQSASPSYRIYLN